MRTEVTWTMGEVVDLVSGALVGPDRGQICRAVTTDSREVEPGDLFVAIEGERFDGHRFIDAAFSAGAAAVLATEGGLARLGDRDVAGGARGSVVVVRDTVQALGALALGHRRRMGATVVAVTGSNGKTSTKELLARALEPFGPVLKTEGNHNNHIGMPMTLLGLRPGHRFAVLELGMNHPGEISYLARVAVPDVGVITNVAAAHTEGLGDLEGVARAKGELYEALGPDAVAVVNLDEPRLVEQALVTSAARVTFGRAEAADVRVREALGVGPQGLGASGVLDVRGVELRVSLGMPGRHNVFNAAAALAACLGLGLDVGVAARAMEGASAPGHRSRLVEAGGLVFLDDCYNANPGSMEAALDTLSDLAEARGAGFVAAVLGDMLELGDLSEAMHRRVGELVAGRGLDLLVTVGDLAVSIGQGAAARVRWIHAEDPIDAARALGRECPRGALVLLKGSRRVGLERVLEAMGREEGR